MMQRRDSPFVLGRISPLVPEGWSERVRKHLEEVGRMANNMRLEEAIAHLDESLNDQGHVWGCEGCKQEHEQLREWLIELKERRAAEVIPGRWIPVTERLPENGQKTLCNFNDGYIAIAMYWDEYNGWGIWKYLGSVTHWMPLPGIPVDSFEKEGDAK